MKAAVETGLTTDEIEWFRDRLSVWGDEWRRDFPWRRTTDPYQLLVAECLLQKTDATKVVPIFETIVARYPTLTALAEASVGSLEAILQPLGLHFRASRLQETALTLVEKHGGHISDREADLLQLPGIGIYTARAILANAFNRPAAVLDSSIARILERVFGLQGGRVKSRDPLLWKAAEEIAPEDRTGLWNLTLIDFGALVCSARNPACQTCPLRDRCRYFACRSSSDTLS